MLKLRPWLSGIIICLVISCSNETIELDETLECAHRNDYTERQWYLESDAGVGVRNDEGETIVEQKEDFAVNIAIVADGIDTRHCEFAKRILEADGRNFYNGSTNPLLAPDYMKRGTMIAGLVAAAANQRGITGVAPKSKLIFFNLLFPGQDTVANQVEAMRHNANKYEISLNTWATIPGSANFFPQNIDDIELWEDTINGMLGVGQGIAESLNPRGIVYIFSAGDNGKLQDYLADQRDSNLNAYANYHGVLAVCSTDSDGDIADYSATGANLWVCGPSIGSQTVISTDVLGVGGYDGSRVNDDYTDEDSFFYGGDVSAALVTGVAALIKSVSGVNPDNGEPNPQLGWRDVRLILAESARKISSDDESWAEGQPKHGVPNQNYYHSEKYGFGLVSASEAINLAGRWRSISETAYLQSDIIYGGALFANGSNLGAFDATVDIGEEQRRGSEREGEAKNSLINIIEFVEIIVESNAVGDLDSIQIELISPTGMVSTLLPGDIAAELSTNNEGGNFPRRWRFGSVRDIGANPQGEWTLRLTRLSPIAEPPALGRWGLRFWGRS